MNNCFVFTLQPGGTLGAILRDRGEEASRLLELEENLSLWGPSQLVDSFMENIGMGSLDGNDPNGEGVGGQLARTLQPDVEYFVRRLEDGSYETNLPQATERAEETDECPPPEPPVAEEEQCPPEEEANIDDYNFQSPLGRYLAERVEELERRRNAGEENPLPDSLRARESLETEEDTGCNRPGTFETGIREAFENASHVIVANEPERECQEPTTRQTNSTEMNFGRVTNRPSAPAERPACPAPSRTQPTSTSPLTNEQIIAIKELIANLTRPAPTAERPDCPAPAESSPTAAPENIPGLSFESQVINSFNSLDDLIGNPWDVSSLFEEENNLSTPLPPGFWGDTIMGEPVQIRPIFRQAQERAERARFYGNGVEDINLGIDFLTNLTDQMFITPEEFSQQNQPAFMFNMPAPDSIEELLLRNPFTVLDPACNPETGDGCNYQ